MIYKVFHSLAEDISAFNVFRYITFRTFLAFLTGFFTCIWVGPALIKKLSLMKQSIRDDGPQTHKSKTGTPTMGGLLILVSLVVTAFLWVDLANPFVQSVLLVTVLYGAIGFIDDYLKVAKKNTKGLPGKLRLAIEFGIAFVVLAWLVNVHGYPTRLYVPFFKNIFFDLGVGYMFFGAFVIVGCANAVNLTDGLDGLAIVPVTVSVVTLGIFAYVTGNATIANYLQVPFINGVGELTPLSGALVAAGLGFLWYNSHPASIFMGDVGSLSLGGFLGIVAVLTNNELLLVFLGGIFVIEALSVITQVASFKLTGKRVFRMAPIHHHFELKGLNETKVVIRFWIVSIILAVLCLSTLKLR